MLRSALRARVPQQEATVGDAARLTLDAIAAAKRCLYIEAQYLTSARVERALAERLEAPDGPEIVVLLNRTSPGRLERFIMGTNGRRLVRRLMRRDRYGRLRIYCPVVPGPAGDCEVKVHAKILIVDDQLLRIGSSNLNNRSVGLDSECDLAIEASDERTSAAIRDLRDDLIAEHVGADAKAVRSAVEQSGSLIAAIEQLNIGSRGLRRFMTDSSGAVRPLPFTWLLDPERPLSPGVLSRLWTTMAKVPIWRLGRSRRA